MIIITKIMIKGNLSLNKPKLIATLLVFRTTNTTANNVKINVKISLI